MTEYHDALAVRTPGVLAAAWRYRATSAVLVVTLALLGIIFASLTTGSPSAQARLTLADPRGNNVFRTGNSSSTDLARYSIERAQFAHSDAVLQRALGALNGATTLSKLRSATSTSADIDASIITISATASTPQRAAAFANAVAEAFQALGQEELQAKQEAALDAIAVERQRVQSALSGTNSAAADSAKDTMTQLDVRDTDIRVAGSLFGDGVEAFNPARAGKAPAPQVVRFGILGAVFGMLIALAIAWTRADRSPPIDWGIDVVSVLGAPLLGEVVELNARDRGALLDLKAAPHVAYEWVTSSMQARKPTGAVLVTSGSHGEGRTVTVLQLAAGAASDGRSVCVVDVDSTAVDGLSTLLGVGGRPGLTEHLSSATSKPIETTNVSGGTWSIDVVPAGDPNALSGTAAVRHEVLRTVLDDLRGRYDVVLIDGPPLLASPIASDLASLVDQVVVVVERGLPADQLIAVRNLLGSVAPTPMGAVFTMVPSGAGTPALVS